MSKLVFTVVLLLLVVVVLLLWWWCWWLSKSTAVAAAVKEPNEWYQHHKRYGRCKNQKEARKQPWALCSVIRPSGTSACTPPRRQRRRRRRRRKSTTSAIGWHTLRVRYLTDCSLRRHEQVIERERERERDRERRGGWHAHEETGDGGARAAREGARVARAAAKTNTLSLLLLGLQLSRSLSLLLRSLFLRCRSFPARMPLPESHQLPLLGHRDSPTSPTTCPVFWFFPATARCHSPVKYGTCESAWNHCTRERERERERERDGGCERSG